MSLGWSDFQPVVETMIFDTLITFGFFAIAAAIGVLLGRNKTVSAIVGVAVWLYLLFNHSDSLGPKMIDYLDVNDPGVPLIFGSIAVGMFAAIADLAQQILKPRITRLVSAVEFRRFWAICTLGLVGVFAFLFAFLGWATGEGISIAAEVWGWQGLGLLGVCVVFGFILAILFYKEMQADNQTSTR